MQSSNELWKIQILCCLWSCINYHTLVKCSLFRTLFPFFLATYTLYYSTTEINMSKIGVGFDSHDDDISLSSSSRNAELWPYSDLWAVRSQHNFTCHHMSSLLWSQGFYSKYTTPVKQNKYLLCQMKGKVGGENETMVLFLSTKI